MSIPRAFLAIAALAALTVAASQAAGAESGRTVELSFDHYNGTWTVLPQGTEVSSGVIPVPKVYVGIGDRLVMKVCNTNPLLFDASISAVTVEDSQLLKSLQSLASLLGNGISSLVTVLGSDKGSPNKAGDKPAEALRKKVLAALKEAEMASKDMAGDLARLERFRLQAVNTLQAKEFGDLTVSGETSHPCEDGKTQQPVECRPDLLEGVSTDIEAVQRTGQSLTSLDYRKLTNLLQDLQSAKKFSATGDHEKVDGAIQAWAKSLVPLEQAGRAPEVVKLARTAREQLQLVSDAAVDLRDALAALEAAKRKLAEAKKSKDAAAIAAANKEVTEAKNACPGSTKRLEDAQAAVDTDGLPLLIAAAPAFEEALTASKALRDGVVEARKTAANLVDFSERLTTALDADWSLRTEMPTQGATWSKDGSYEIKLTASSPYAAEIGRNPRLKDVTLTVKTGWKGGTGLGVGVGVTYTPLSEDTYAALPMPSDPTKKSPQVQKSETRAGQLVMLMNWRFWETFHPETRDWTVKPGLELGALLSTSKPGVCLGLSGEFWKSLRIGLGWTWQRVTVLDGQDETTVVASSDEIRTRQVFRGNWYASMTFALDSITLFKKD